MNTTKFDNLSFYVFLVLIFLLPFFFIPSASVPFQSTKSMLVVIGALVVFFVWIISLLKNPVLKIYKTPIILALLALPIVVIISGLFSGNVANSFIGQGFEVGTAAFISVLSLL